MRKISSSAAWQIVDGEAVIVDVASGRTIAINETGSFIWTRLDLYGDVEIAQMLSASYGISADRAMQHVDEFVRELSSRNLIEIAA